MAEAIKMPSSSRWAQRWKDPPALSLCEPLSQKPWTTQISASQGYFGPSVWPCRRVLSAFHFSGVTSFLSLPEAGNCRLWCTLARCSCTLLVYFLPSLTGKWTHKCGSSWEKWCITQTWGTCVKPLDFLTIKLACSKDTYISWGLMYFFTLISSLPVPTFLIPYFSFRKQLLMPEVKIAIN
jgi:hypothetical protein